MFTAAARRFSDWGVNAARLLLVVVAVFTLAAALGGSAAPRPVAVSVQSVLPAGAGQGAALLRDADLLLYGNIVERVAAGDNYYDAALAEQRARSFPVRPGFAVRLPTLAMIQALIGPTGTMAASVLLLAAIGVAWWRRFGEEGVSGSDRRIAVALVIAGSSFLLNRYYHNLHELWAGGLIALSLGMHRAGRWGGALAVVAVALAIRELVLPLVLLMAAMAGWHRRWRETAAWGALALGFAALLEWHHAVLASQTSLADPVGPHWLSLRGLPGWIGNVIESSQLHLLPIALAGPIAVLALLGWAGRRTPAGATTTLLLLGYGAAFMIAGRANNFYWGLIVTPVLFAGLAFAPSALADLWTAAWRRVDAAPEGAAHHS